MIKETLFSHLSLTSKNSPNMLDSSALINCNDTSAWQNLCHSRVTDHIAVADLQC